MHRVGMPAHAYRAAALGALVAGLNSIALDTDIFDPLNYISGGVFTAPNAGYYRFDYNVRVTATAAGQGMEARVVLNPAGVNLAVGIGSRADSDTTTSILSSSGSGGVLLNAGDILQLSVSLPAGITALLVAGGQATNYLLVQQTA